MSKPVEDYVLDGDCDGCDQDPAECYNLGYCIYDHEQEKEANNDENTRKYTYRWN